jgi:hypothetical protein
MPTIYEVIWIDSNTIGGWCPEVELDENEIKTLVCRTVGYLYKVTPDRVMLAESYAEFGQWGNIMMIPRVSIISGRKIK